MSSAKMMTIFGGRGGISAARAGWAQTARDNAAMAVRVARGFIGLAQADRSAGGVTPQLAREEGVCSPARVSAGTWHFVGNHSRRSHDGLPAELLLAMWTERSDVPAPT